MSTNTTDPELAVTQLTAMFTGLVSLMFPDQDVEDVELTLFDEGVKVIAESNKRMLKKVEEQTKNG